MEKITLESLATNLQELSQQLTGFSRSVDKRFESLEENLKSRFNVIDAKLERIDERLDGLDLHAATTNFKLEAIHRRLNQHDSLLNVVADHVNKHEEAIGELRARWQTKHA